MLYKTRGLVLNTINYNEKYNLTPILTEDFGCITYMTPKTKSKSGRLSRSSFFPLALLDMEVEHLHKRDIQRIREVRSAFLLYELPTDMNKTAMAFFLAEFLSRILKAGDSSKLVFDFLFQAVQILEMSENSIANFHLVVLLKLSRLFGFYPNFEDYTPGMYFDMMNGEFVRSVPFHHHYIAASEAVHLVRLSRITFENMHKFIFKRNERNWIVEKMIEYYRLHLNDFPDIKSVEVLHELF